ncbi:MAG TPA: RsmE family RNA methyltransferase [Chloroflexota bacterium]|nr:RsmE family RNA methyltransferase [Chloroflexota bacterium]
MQRFFVSPRAIDRGQVEFARDQSRQIATVLRARVGERVIVLDNQGWLYEVRLDQVHPEATWGTVISRRLAPNEPRTKLTLYTALLKGDKLELVFQKCTEIGVSGFVPIICERCVVGSIVSEHRQARWERIITEAAEQSERGRLPSLQPAMLFQQACEQVRGRGLSFIAWERGERSSLRAALAARARESARPFVVNLFTGPEGGFTEDEIATASAYGIIPVGLGPRILRAETAPIVGATLVLAHGGDLE